MSVPFVKITNGWVTQEYDENHKLVSSFFKSSDEVPLNEDLEGNNFCVKSSYWSDEHAENQRKSLLEEGFVLVSEEEMQKMLSIYDPVFIEVRKMNNNFLPESHRNLMSRNLPGTKYYIQFGTLLDSSYKMPHDIADYDSKKFESYILSLPDSIIERAYKRYCHDIIMQCYKKDKYKTLDTLLNELEDVEEYSVTFSNYEDSWGRIFTKTGMGYVAYTLLSYHYNFANTHYFSMNSFKKFLLNNEYEDVIERLIKTFSERIEIRELEMLLDTLNKFIVSNDSIRLSILEDSYYGEEE